MMSIRIARTLAIAGLAFGTTASADRENKELSQRGERELGHIYFDFDSAEPIGNLLMVANVLECTPNETIILDAYTDDTGPTSYNKELAQRRAEAVRDQFVQFGISRDRIVIGVYGERGDAMDRALLERRVEVRTSDEPLAMILERRSEVAVIDAEGNVQVATP